MADLPKQVYDPRDRRDSLQFFFEYSGNCENNNQLNNKRIIVRHNKCEFSLAGNAPGMNNHSLRKFGNKSSTRFLKRLIPFGPAAWVSTAVSSGRLLIVSQPADALAPRQSATAHQRAKPFPLTLEQRALTPVSCTRMKCRKCLQPCRRPSA